MNNEFDMQCYGCNGEDFIEEIRNCITYKLAGANMVVAGLMSDAQEEIAMGMAERARQTLNRAKLILGEIMEGNLIGNVAR